MKKKLAERELQQMKINYFWLNHRILGKQLISDICVYYSKEYDETYMIVTAFFFQKKNAG
jgi:hypothetical protein